MRNCYICKTCNSYVKKVQVPCQAVVNLFLENIPDELDCLNTS